MMGSCDNQLLIKSCQQCLDEILISTERACIHLLIFMYMQVKISSKNLKDFAVILSCVASHHCVTKKEELIVEIKREASENRGEVSSVCLPNPCERLRGVVDTDS